MANKSGPQPDIKYRPACKAELRNVPREAMKSKWNIRKDGTVAQNTQYICMHSLQEWFEINQDQ